MVNGIIPGALIDGRGATVLGGQDPTKLHSTVTLVEIKGLGTINGETAIITYLYTGRGETVQQRAERIERDIIKHSEAQLDA